MRSTENEEGEVLAGSTRVIRGAGNVFTGGAGRRCNRAMFKWEGRRRWRATWVGEGDGGGIVDGGWKDPYTIEGAVLWSEQGRATWYGRAEGDVRVCWTELLKGVSLRDCFKRTGGTHRGCLCESVEETTDNIRRTSSDGGPRGYLPISERTVLHSGAHEFRELRGRQGPES